MMTKEGSDEERWAPNNIGAKSEDPSQSRQVLHPNVEWPQSDIFRGRNEPVNKTDPEGENQARLSFFLFKKGFGSIRTMTDNAQRGNSILWVSSWAEAATQVWLPVVYWILMLLFKNVCYSHLQRGGDFRSIRKFGLSEISFEISLHHKLLGLYIGARPDIDLLYSI